jgi:hypothetical protein
MKVSGQASWSRPTSAPSADTTAGTLAFAYENAERGQLPQPPRFSFVGTAHHLLADASPQLRTILNVAKSSFSLAAPKGMGAA